MLQLAEQAGWSHFKEILYPEDPFQWNGAFPSSQQFTRIVAFEGAK
jgi:hypothetical protein